MGYAIRKDGQGWRAVDGAEDCLEMEYYSDSQPELWPDENLLVKFEAKRAKEKALAEIVVTTSSGKVFDGNDRARINMLSAIAASQLLGQTSAQWKLANNTVAEVTVDEIKEALALAIQAVGAIVTV